MLTATYSLVAIATEQEKTRNLLQRLHQFVQSAWKGLQSLDFGFLESGYNRFIHFDQYCRSRKIELYLIPSLRGICREADGLVAELDALSGKGAHHLHTIASHLAVTFEPTRLQASEICDAMQAYCHYMSERVNMEEHVLLPMARRLLSVEDWFSVAAQFLSRDSAGGKGRRNWAKSRPTDQARIPSNMR